VLNDGKILAEFAANRSEAAFAQLVERHGGLVYGACRRILGPSGLADDAYQATFMILGRKAGSLGRRKTIAGWLTVTAANVSRRIQKAELRRRAREEEASRMSAQVMAPGPEDIELGANLDVALSSLPGPQREAVLLHHMQGRTLAEVAQLTEVSQRTAKWRVADGLERLRRRLKPAGSSLGASALVSFLSTQGQVVPPAALSAALPAAVVGFAGTGTAVGIAASVGKVAEEVLKAMFWIKVKIAAAVLAVVCATEIAVPVVDRIVRAAEVPAAAVPDKKPVAVAGVIKKVATIKKGYTALLVPAPDGANLAIIQTIHAKLEGKSGPWWHLMVVDVATGKSKLLEKVWGMPPAGQATGAQRQRITISWAPDSSKFVFANSMDGTCRAKVFDKAGKKLAAFSAGSFKAKYPRIKALPSPDGKHLAFFNIGHLGSTRIAIFNWDGTRKAICKIPGTGIGYLAWLPDSKMLRVVPYVGIKNPDNDRISQWRNEGVYSVTLDGAKAIQLNGTMREDKAWVSGLASDGQSVILGTGGFFKGNFKYKLLNIKSGKSVEIASQNLGFLKGKLPGRFWAPTDLPGFVVLGSGDCVIRYVTPNGKINKLANGISIPTWRGGGQVKTGGNLLAFNKGVDLYVTKISVAGAATKVGANWLKRRVFKKRPAAKPVLQRRNMHDQVAFSRNGKHLFAILNSSNNKGSSIVELPLGQ
jgi:RNA polymerase sigma factor (sigma-70 family)